MKEDLIIIAFLAVVFATVLLSIVLILRLKKTMQEEGGKDTESERRELLRLFTEQKFELLSGFEQRVAVLRNETANNAKSLREEVARNANEFRAEMTGQMTSLRTEIGTKLSDQAKENEQKLENIRSTMETRIRSMQEENTNQLDKMRATVDEKLQKTLNDRITQSFKLVSEQLDIVSKGLGEMQNIASGVGDLKKVLSNVKNRGILGEYQLGAILTEILSPEQYVENFSTKKNSDRVEFAIRLPGEDGEAVYLPIDAKFPADAYARLLDAYEKGDTTEIDAAGKILDGVIRQSAKTIHEKYVEPPFTTDFAIMFLPFEGLYAEVVRRGMVEELQRLYKINIAGPSTMAALLNSLQMGFKTLAIQKRSGEVWKVLSEVKTEFTNFEKVLNSAKKRIEQTNDELDKLIGTRTRAINRKLKDVSSPLDIADPDAQLEIREDSFEDA
ncbi:MAG: DNA recombination protein RmuC [Clostridiales Family XIII bacterium]|jgi:DNA recombination protein RmuC|nr:DNA recombination protein RmuC [Clostridiales Family XIII bacterium]